MSSGFSKKRRIKMKSKWKIFSFFVVLVMLLSLGSTAFAVCPQNGVTPLTVGPVNPQNGFPAWFQDTNGRSVELCLDPNFCFFDPPDPSNPFSTQIGFGPEAFWWSADASIDNPAQGFSALLVMAVEAAFANEEPVDGEQFPFTRLRIRLDVPATGTYTVTHPYGQEVFNVTAVGAGDEVRMSRDIEVIGFNTTHNGAVGPLLVAMNPQPPAGFVGDFNILQTVTGSPCETNFFRIQPPAGVNIGAGAGQPVTTNLFAVQGKIFTGILSTPLTVTRTTYARANPGTVSVFANSAPTATLTVSGGPNFPGAPVPMVGDPSGRFFAHVDIANTTTLPAFVTVTATNPGNSATSINSSLVDVVNVTRADYSMATGQLTIQASSSDQAVPPTLTAVGLGTLTAGSLTVSVAVPPAFVLVQSSAGGEDTRLVNIISAPPPTFSISGTITNSAGGGPLSGVTVNLTGPASASTTTNASGVYTFTGLAAGNYTVTPSFAGFTFAPVNRTVPVTNANVTGQDFVGTSTVQTFSISGTVRERGVGLRVGAPVSGVTITLSGTSSGTTTTDANGNYVFTGRTNGSYTVTPSQTGFTFIPASRAVTINNANVTGQNFTRN